MSMSMSMRKVGRPEDAPFLMLMLALMPYPLPCRLPYPLPCRTPGTPRR